MQTTTLTAGPGERAKPADWSVVSTAGQTEGRWVWVDVEIDEGDAASDLDALAALHGLDSLALSDAVSDENSPKLDNFDDHLVVVLHGLADADVRTYEITCFLTTDTLITLHRGPSPSLRAFTKKVVRSAELADGGPDQLLARLADVVSRRYLGVVDVLDRQLDELSEMALDAHPRFLEELTTLRHELADIRWVLRPQREVFDTLRRDPTRLLTDAGRRRFSDVYDSAQRAVQEFDAARATLAEALGAYQGAEARHATEITKVLTIYAAVMFPLSLIAGVYGMNISDLPGSRSPHAFWWIMAAMSLIAMCSLGLFVASGWIRPPGARSAGKTIGKGLAEAAHMPAQVVGSLYEATRQPLRHVGPRRKAGR